MNQYLIYKHYKNCDPNSIEPKNCESENIYAIKVGFSWPGLFFGLGWFIYIFTQRQRYHALAVILIILWFGGFALTIIFSLITGLELSDMKVIFSSPLVITGILIVIHLLLGFMGNRLLRYIASETEGVIVNSGDTTAKRSFNRSLGTVIANNKEGAIFMYQQETEGKVSASPFSP